MNRVGNPTDYLQGKMSESPMDRGRHDLQDLRIIVIMMSETGFKDYRDF